MFLGYLLLALGYLFKFSTQDVSQNPLLTATEFTPVLIIGMCYLVLSFTCGEFFGLLRYQFDSQNQEPGFSSLRLIATRSLSIFFMGSISFYFLRAGLQESFLETIFFILMPLFLGSYLIFILKRLNQAHMMAPWYYNMKITLLSACILGQFIANMVLFFPEFIATLPTTL